MLYALSNLMWIVAIAAAAAAVLQLRRGHS